MQEAGEASKTRACKRRRLDDLERFRRRVPHVSQSALSAVLKEAKRSGIPELSCRKDVRAARDAQLDVVTEYGPLYRSEDLEPEEDGDQPKPKLNYIHPIALLAFLLLICQSFSLYVERLHDLEPSTAADPWSLALYSDEVTPGNQLSNRNERRIQVLLVIPAV